MTLIKRFFEWLLTPYYHWRVHVAGKKMMQRLKKRYGVNLEGMRKINHDCGWSGDELNSDGSCPKCGEYNPWSNSYGKDI